jgi:4-hydroxybenzoate polyprenyltransferase
MDEVKVSTLPAAVRTSPPALPWRAYAQLVRLPNVFTAMADIFLGWCAALATGTPLGQWPALLLILGSSSCLYCAGMVWNDFFDVEQDRRERPFRPLPSGRISRRRAGLLATALLSAGLGLSALAGLFGNDPRWLPGSLAGVLALMILLYDAWLKRTWAGPIAMGSCRLLNVLLSFTLAGTGLPGSARIYVALVVGLYIVGVTWFARTEARTSSQPALAGAAVVMLTALVLALAVPVWLDGSSSAVLFPYALVVLGFLVGLPVSRAITLPSPLHVQLAVKRALMGLVILDAVLASAFIGAPGFALLLLLVPVLFLGRWIYST